MVFIHSLDTVNLFCDATEVAEITSASVYRVLCV
jgi:hypothetical protein